MADQTTVHSNIPRHHDQFHSNVCRSELPPESELHVGSIDYSHPTTQTQVILVLFEKDKFDWILLGLALFLCGLILFDL